MTRPAFTPTPTHRELVSQLVSFGVPLVQICQSVLDAKGKAISENTLRKYFAEELEHSALEANRQVAQTLFRKALSGDTAAMIFWLKTRARWTTTDKVEISGPDGRPVAIETAKARFMEKLASATVAARTEAASEAPDA